MWQQEIPSVGWEQWCGSGKDGEEVIFERSDGAFGSVMAVDVGQDQLQGTVVVGNGLLEGTACFVVHDVECWLSVCGGELCKNVGVCSNAMGNLFGCKRADQDGIGIGMEGNHDALVAAAGTQGESSSVV
jgi:hypothetical protein